jgi:hypothetical protein
VIQTSYIWSCFTVVLFFTSDASLTKFDLDPPFEARVYLQPQRGTIALVCDTLLYHWMPTAGKAFREIFPKAKAMTRIVDWNQKKYRRSLGAAAGHQLFSGLDGKDPEKKVYTVPRLPEDVAYAEGDPSAPPIPSGNFPLLLRFRGEEGPEDQLELQLSSLTLEAQLARVM